MNFFKPFDIINPYRIQGKNVVGVDLTRRKKIPRSLKEDTSFFIFYEVREGETPEVLADRVYDDVEEYWILMEFNDIVDVSADWPLDQYALERYIHRKYDDVYAIHHYISASSGAVVDSDWVNYDRIPVTNFEHETNINDLKRNIKIPLPENKGILISMHKGKVR